MSAESLLHEIENSLEKLINSGTETVIDLNNFSIDTSTEKKLREILGSGEVTATLEIFGCDTIQETNIHGVWWVHHTDDNGAIITKSIYISYVPSLLPALQEDVEYSLSVLKKKMEEIIE